MTTPTPADAVRAALAALQNPTGEEVAVATTRALADALLPRPAIADRSTQADRDRLLHLQFLTLANELAGNPPPAASREALSDAREESLAAAWQGIEPEQVLPAVEALAAAIGPTPTPPATAPGDLVQWLKDHAEHLQRMEAIGALPEGELAPMLADAAALLQQQESNLATTREALRRIVVWGGFRSPSAGYSADVVLGVADWFADGMTAPLPPLPPLIGVRRHPRGPGAHPTPSAPALPPAIAYECGDGVQIQAANNERTSWAVQDGNWCLNSRGRWESEPYASSRDAGYLARARWPSAEAAWAALLEYRAGEGVKG